MARLSFKDPPGAYLVLLIAIFIGLTGCYQQGLKVRPHDDTLWWACIVNHGHHMPMAEDYSADLSANTYGNQAQPLLLSNQGDVIWCESPFSISYRKGVLKIKSDDRINLCKSGGNLADAYRFASEKYFPASGLTPDERLFTAPQYNTWIELLNDQNQEGIMAYAKGLIDNEFPPGVLMIDNHWQEDHGRWDFHPGRFPDPHTMIDSLHRMGFTIMLWICPFVSPDTDELFLGMESRDLFMKKGKNTAMVRWWDGVSALLDFSNPSAVKWFEDQLSFLVEEYHIDGFKFDAGDPKYYYGLHSYLDILPNEHCRLYGEFGLKYPLNEYRAMWKMGGQPIAERLRDKTHTWEDLQKLIPHMILSGISGYPFSCPDMIGGGEYSSFYGKNVLALDRELIVRSAQVHALMPMMQFSVAPWKILNPVELESVKNAVSLRMRLTDYIMSHVHHAALTNEPILKSLEYDYPNMGYAWVTDQFLIGEDIMVAPVIQKGKDRRSVLIPPGIWQNMKGEQIIGPKKLEVDAGLNDIPVYFKTSPESNMDHIFKHKTQQ